MTEYGEHGLQILMPVPEVSLQRMDVMIETSDDR